MRITGSLINIDVPDIKLAEDFYVRVFAMTVTRRFGEKIVELSGFGVPCYLLEKSEGSGAEPLGQQRRNYSRHWTPVHLDITVRDIQDVYERALLAGAQAESTINDAPFGKIVQMSDPFGHGFCLIEFNELGYDALLKTPKSF